jgi:hypothetical protein
MRQDVLEARFDSLERRFEDFQQEMREFRAEMRDFRREITADVQSLRGELYATKRWMMTMWLSGVLAFIAIFVEISPPSLSVSLRTPCPLRFLLPRHGA